MKTLPVIVDGGLEIYIVEDDDNDIASKQIEKQNPKISGAPIPEKEVTRGASITRVTLRDDMENWRKDPTLSPYAVSEDEEEEYIDRTLS